MRLGITVSLTESRQGSVIETRVEEEKVANQKNLYWENRVLI